MKTKIKKNLSFTLAIRVLSVFVFESKGALAGNQCLKKMIAEFFNYSVTLLLLLFLTGYII